MKSIRIVFSVVRSVSFVYDRVTTTGLVLPQLKNKTKRKNYKGTKNVKHLFLYTRQQMVQVGSPQNENNKMGLKNMPRGLIMSLAEQEVVHALPHTGEGQLQGSYKLDTSQNSYRIAKQSSSHQLAGTSKHIYEGAR